MVVGHVEPEALAVRLDAKLGREPDQEREDPVACDRAAGGRDALREPRLDPLPLRRECLVPVRFEQRGEALDEPGRIVEELDGGAARAGPRAPRAQKRSGPDAGIAEHALAGRSRPAAVVVDRPQELVRHHVRPQRAQPCQLGLEVLVRRRRIGKHAVRERPAVEERQRGDLALQRLRQPAHRAYPLVLERVVLRLGEDVQALHSLEQRRVAERECRPMVVCESETDGDPSSLPHAAPAVNEIRS